MKKGNSTSMRDQLQPLRNKVRSTPHNHGPENKSTLKNPNYLLKDGEDHINIYEKSAVELGVFLAHSSETPFVHPILGSFNTVEAFWYYIRSQERDDRIRSLTSKSVKGFATYNLTPNKWVRNFRAVIMDANWHKLLTYPRFMRMIEESELPFDMYYVNPEKKERLRHNFASWVIRGFEEIRNAVKEKREPDFEYLMSDKDLDLYIDIRMPEVEVQAPAKLNLHDDPAETKEEEEVSPVETVAEETSADISQDQTESTTIVDESPFSDTAEMEAEAVTNDEPTLTSMQTSEATPAVAEEAAPAVEADMQESNREEEEEDLRDSDADDDMRESDNDEDDNRPVQHVSV